MYLQELDVLRREHTQLSEAVRESGVCRSELENRSSETDKLRAELTRLRSLTKVILCYTQHTHTHTHQ